MKKKKSDELFAETKLKMVMKLSNMSREEAVEKIESQHRTPTSAVNRDGDEDLLISAEEFFGG